ncbi:MAG: AbrB/MazE/SpoVT family DNA-binding domain-containing protein [Caulobacteraceae bacterium]|nr:AbrB/MazE/SpoVT family DNA-binding domain-containing protein [Caulobacter sp.]
MPAPKPTVTTTLSTKGQVILPKAVRESRGWKPGDRLSVEETPDGALILRLQRKPLFPPTRLEDVVGMIKYDGPPVSIEDMHRAAVEGAVRRFQRAVESDRDRD